MKLLKDQRTMLKEAISKRASRRQLIWIALNTDAARVREHLRQHYQARTNVVDQIAQARYVEAAETVPEQPANNDGEEEPVVDAAKSAKGKGKGRRAADDDEEDGSFRPIDAHDETFHHNLAVLEKVFAETAFQPKDYQRALTNLFVMNRSNPHIPGTRRDRFSLPWQTLAASHMAGRMHNARVYQGTRNAVDKRDAKRKWHKLHPDHVAQLRSAVVQCELAVQANEVDVEMATSRLDIDELRATLEASTKRLDGAMLTLSEAEEEIKILKDTTASDAEVLKNVVHPGSILMDEVGIGKTDSALSSWLNVSAEPRLDVHDGAMRALACQDSLLTVDCWRYPHP
jgi:hypothetical protein